MGIAKRRGRERTYNCQRPVTPRYDPGVRSSTLSVDRTSGAPKRHRYASEYGKRWLTRWSAESAAATTYTLLTVLSRVEQSDSQADAAARTVATSGLARSSVILVSTLGGEIGAGRRSKVSARTGALAAGPHGVRRFGPSS